MKTVHTLTALLLAGLALQTQADVITDWNAKTDELITDAKIGTPPAVRLTALVQSAAYGAVNTITQRYPATQAQAPAPAQAAKGASIEAAVAAAHGTVLLKLLPAQQAAIDAAYQAALAPITDAAAKATGIAIGEKAAADVL